MSDIETGVKINITNDGLSGAKATSDVLENIANQADKVNQALDSQGLDNFNKSLENIGDTFKQITETRLRDNQQQQIQSQQQQRMSGFNKVFSQAGNAIVQAGSGDVGGAGTSGLSSIMGLISKNPALAVLGGIGLTGAIVGNKLAEQYGERAKPASRLAALEGTLGTSIAENDKALQRAMQDTVDSVAQYGKTYEEGTRAREQFLRSGGRNFDKTGAGAYSLFYGSDMGQLAAFEGQTQRYGQEGGLQTTRALLESQGLGPGQYDEVLGGLQDTFSSFLSRGIIKPLEEIAQSQEFFSRAGDTFKGALGSQRLQGMNQVITGAGRLGSQDDIFAYRAAQEMTDGGIWETRKQLEQGLTPEMFKGLIQQYEEFGLNQEQQMIKFSDYFGLGATATEKLFNLKDQDIETGKFRSLMDQQLPSGAGKSTITGYNEDVENITQDIASTLGETAYETRATIVETGAKIVSSIDNWVDQREAKKEEARWTPEKEVEFKEKIDKREAEDFYKNIMFSPEVPGSERMLGKIEAAYKAGVSVEDVYESIGGIYKKSLEEGSELGTSIGTYETMTMENLLRTLIEETKKNTEAVLAPIEVES